MKGLIVWAQGIVAAFGGLGLFFVAFLDASFVSLPEVNDILVVWMVAKNKELFVYYAAMATLGSMAGCFALYWLAWKGGEAFVRKRAKSDRASSRAWRRSGATGSWRCSFRRSSRRPRRSRSSSWAPAWPV